jgi:hypothetical protein
MALMAAAIQEQESRRLGYKQEEQKEKHKP